MAYAPETTLCLINFKDGIYDVTGQSTVINHGSSLTSEQYKYNSSSCYFNYNEQDTVVINLSSEAKTVSMWFYPTGSNTSGWYPTIWSSQSSTNAGGTYTHVDDGSYGTNPIYRVNANGSSLNNGSAGSSAITRNTWHHYVYCNDGSGNHYFFLDGQLQTTVVQSNPNELTVLCLGGLMNSSTSFVSGCYYSGYIGELLITSDCLYTADFEVPSEMYEWENPVAPPLTIDSESNYGSYYGSIANVTDGDESTYWWTNSAQSQSQFILFTFSKPVIFHGLTAKTLNNTGDCISSGTVLQTSENGSDWNTVGNFSGEAECSFSNLEINNVTYVRIYVETSSNKWLCVNEITLDYDEMSSQFIYLKTNDSWQTVSKVYKKQNSTWVEQTDLGLVFDENVNYKIETITQ